jgi:hypothetical protein
LLANNLVHRCSKPIKQWWREVSWDLPNWATASNTVRSIGTRETVVER